MAIMSIQHAIEAASSMQALRNALATDLDEIESRIHQLTASQVSSYQEVADEMQICLKARAALHSGLASITDVLGWVHLLTEKDAHGNEIVTVQSLPTVPILSIN